jgi:tRNA(Arg) A34 adenosine deaminase TadA
MNVITDSNRYMLRALAQAKIAFKKDEVPVAALIVDTKTNKIIARAHNLCEELHDPTAHAELLAIRMACNLVNSNKLPYCDLYVTLEPCPMCATAISFARIRRLYFGAYDSKSGGVEHGPKIFSSSSAHHVPEIYGGIKEREASLLMKEFFKQKRSFD